MSGIKAVSFGMRAALWSVTRGGLQGDATRRFRGAGRLAAATLGALMLMLVGVSAAAARTAYVSNDIEESILPINLATNAAGTPIADAHRTSSIAITPDGKLAYAPTAAGESRLFPFNLETSLAETPISLAVEGKLKVEPESLAITPDGKYVYVTDEETNGKIGAVSVVEVSTGKVVKVIEAGFEPEGVAITPNGEFAWVADKANVKQGTVTVIEHASEPENAKVIKTIDIGTAEECKDEGGKPANACVEPEKIAITPDGQAAYVADGANGTVTKINTKTYAIEATITVGAAGEDLREPDDIAISPDGQTGYASDGEAGTVVPIDLKTNEAGTPITVGKPETEPRGLALAPSGKTLYVAVEAESKVKAIATASNTIVAEAEASGEPDGIAIVPDQGPTAAFSATAVAAGSASTFNAGGSSAPEGGTITSYEWSFGDGATETTNTPEASHVYAHGGKYEVKVRTTDGEGCSEALLFTGQTAYCNADPAADVQHTITVPSATAEPKVNEVTPDEGPEAGLTTVTIHGEHLEDATEVSFGGSSAGIPFRDTETEIEVQTPAHAAGAVEVCTTTGSGTGCKAAAFTYTAPAPEPVVSEVTPNEGPEEGHTKVVIHGEHLEDATEVSFGIQFTRTVIRDTATEVEVETPGHSAAVVKVCVTTTTGSGCMAKAFTYVAPLPVVTEVTPDEGSVEGHTMVTIHGEHLLDLSGPTTVSFGSSPAVNTPARETETEIEGVETPAHAAGAVEVCVTLVSGTGCKAAAFTYTAAQPPPVVTEVTPDEGPEVGHTKVTIHGEHLEDVTEIAFGFETAGTPIRDTATEVEVETPSYGAGLVEVCVTTASGTGCKEGAFRYTAPPPVVSAVTPDEGPEAGHTKVTIHGEHLLDAAGTDKVSFGGSSAVNAPSKETETEIEGVETPAHAAGAVEVCVTTASATGCKAGAFTYIAPVVVGKNEANINVNSEPVSEVQSLTTTCTALNLGAWTPGSESNSEAHCELTATSTAASSTLTAEDTEAASKGAHAGYLENAGSYLTDALQAKATDGHGHGTSASFLSLGEHPVALLSFSEPISPDPVTFTVKQHVGAEEGLRKGTYQETVTLTLANTEP